jgi:hypothetical protein
MKSTDINLNVYSDELSNVSTTLAINLVPENLEENEWIERGSYLVQTWHDKTSMQLENSGLVKRQIYLPSYLEMRGSGRL